MTFLIRMTSLATLVALSTLGSSAACAQQGPPPTAGEEATAAASSLHPALRDPSQATETAPATYRVKLETTKGDVVIEVVREWAPNGADRFYNLVKIGYYDGTAFFRVISGFMAQIGFHGNPKVNFAWRAATFPDDPITQPNTRGMVTFAMTGRPNSRTTQFFINYGDNSYLKQHGKFAPFAKVVEGMEVVDSLYSGYGEGAPRGKGPDQGRLAMEGNAYLEASFPKMDYIKKATIVE